MLDMMVATWLYGRVMQNDRVKNKFLGFYWREFLLDAAISGSVLAAGVLLLRPEVGWAVAAAVFAVLLLCLVLPAVHWRMLR